MTEPRPDSGSGGRRRVLVVEDDSSHCRLLVDELRELDLSVRSAASAEAALARSTAWSPDLIVSDMRLPGANGLDLLQQTRKLASPPSFIVVTAFGTVSQAVRAVQAGADDFLTKPVDLEHLRVTVTKVLETRHLREELQRYRQLARDDGFHGMLGRSAPMERLFAEIAQVARGTGPVLIAGESGVGKDLVARAIHREGPRAAGPFLAVNCAGIPDGLVESEFFGHAAGAFTGAVRTRKGLFVEADRGTLLLDEVAELPLVAQAKLLRVLQEGTVRPVGADAEKAIGVRVLAATNRDLAASVASGSLRQDLYYRLDTFTLHVPALRDRGDDAELLAGRFLQQSAARLDKAVHGFSAAAIDRLRTYSFPGNVRELQSAVERAVTFCEGRTIQVEHFPERMREISGASGPAARAETILGSLIDHGELPTLAEMEARYVRHVVDRLGGNKRRAAALLGVGRGTLYRRLG